MNLKMTLALETEYPTHWDKDRARRHVVGQWHEQAEALGVRPTFSAFVQSVVDGEGHALVCAEVEVTR